jgi:hypothetical protein
VHISANLGKEKGRNVRDLGGCKTKSSVVISFVSWETSEQIILIMISDEIQDIPMKELIIVFPPMGFILSVVF